MTWKDIKQAAEDLGIQDTDEICVIECKFQDGDKILHKSKMGKAVKLTEGVSQSAADYKGCAA